MRTVEQIVEQTRAAAGADFAFVLTRKGRLVTHRAPRDMPEEGRMRIVRAARPLVGTEQVIEVTLPREELVPFGGAAPVDVFIGVVAEQAILCMVMATWADKLRVAPALNEGMRAIAPLLRRGLPSARRPAEVEPAKGSPYVADRDAPEPAPNVPRPPDSAPMIDLRVSLLPELPRIASLPDISVSEAPLGRESLAAIGREISAFASAPEITVSEAPLGRESMVAIRAESGAGFSLPEITVSEAPLGRESLVAIRRDAAAGGSAPEIAISEVALGRESLAAIELDKRGPRPGSSPEAIRVELASMPDIEVTESLDRLTMPYPAPDEAAEPAARAAARLTLPWVEPAPDAKRAADAARIGRKLAPPKVTIKLEDADKPDARTKRR